MSTKTKGLLSKLKLFYSSLKLYKKKLDQINQSQTILGHWIREKDELREKLVGEAGQLSQYVTELIGTDQFSTYVFGKPQSFNVWAMGLREEFDRLTAEALNTCIDYVLQAMGRLKSDIADGKRDAQTGQLLNKPDKSESEQSESITVKANWKAIEKEFGVTKNKFGRKINFISDNFRRNIIFRDVEQAFTLASCGFSKPAVILAGSVIEELLRIYLIYKNIKPNKDDFNGYIETCEQQGLLKDSISRVSHVVRQFRNLVHLSAEKN